MITKAYIVKTEKGLHARPVSEIVRVANNYESNITMNFHGEAVNAKSIMSLLALGIRRGDKLVLTVYGTDEITAFEAMEKILTVTI